jgi:hypothetical protein
VPVSQRWPVGAQWLSTEQRSRQVLDTQISLAAQSLAVLHSTQRAVDELHTSPGGQSSAVEQVVIGLHSLSTHSA